MKRNDQPAVKKRKIRIQYNVQGASLYWEASNYFMIQEEDMKLNDITGKEPCAKCPYKLGQVQTISNPCPQCKQNGYDSYERFLKLPRQGKIPESGDK